LPRTLTTLVLFVCSSFISSVTVRAQTVTSPRVGIEVAAGPALEVATAGNRDSQRGLLAVPTLGVRVASWFEYTLEGHLSRHVTPVSGTVFGIVPVGFRIHMGPRKQVHLSAGAGLTWTDLAGLRGVEQRRNYITQIGAGITRHGPNGSGLSLEARLFHLSNLHAAPPNLGMEGFTVLVGYRLPH
jgi:hypothetical protein